MQTTLRDTTVSAWSRLTRAARITRRHILDGPERSRSKTGSFNMKTKGQTRQSSVDDMPTLAVKRHQWLECLYGDDPNSIGYQVYVLLDDFLSWWTINEARRFTPQDEKGAVKGSALMHGLLDRCFATSQMVAVRRLCDSAYRIDDKTRGVWSLNSLLGDLAKHTLLLTRQVILATEGLGDDPESLEREAYQAVRNSASYPQARLAQFRSRNRDVDLLAGITSNDRSANDRARPEVFEGLQRRLNTTCKDICDKVNKFLVHAGTPESRNELIDDSWEVTPNDLREAAIEIRDTFDFVSNVVLPRPASQGNHVPRGCMTIPTAELFDPLEHMDQPLILTQDLRRVRDIREEMKAKLSECKDPRSVLTSLRLL